MGHNLEENNHSPSFSRVRRQIETEARTIFSRPKTIESASFCARSLAHVPPYTYTSRKRKRRGRELRAQRPRGLIRTRGKQAFVSFSLSLRPYPVREKFRAPLPVPLLLTRAPLFARSERESFPRQLLSFSFRRGIKQGATCVRTKCEVKDERIHLSWVN